MTITDVRIRKMTKEGNLRAIVSITIDGEFAVHDIKVIDNNGKLFVAMPSRRAPEGEYKDIAHPISAKVREYVQGVILQKYEKELFSGENN